MIDERHQLTINIRGALGEATLVFEPSLGIQMLRICADVNGTKVGCAINEEQALKLYKHIGSFLCDVAAQRTRL